MAAEVLVRRRTAADLAECLELVRAVHDLDGYPRYVGPGLQAFIEVEGALGAWVADGDGLVIGHVALNPRSSDAVMELVTSYLGRQAHELAVVARLVVAPDHRRGGVARMLLATAADDAFRAGRWPVLDVVTQSHGAISLYEGCGWVRAGRVTAKFPDGTELDEYVFVAPPSVAPGE